MESQSRSSSAVKWVVALAFVLGLVALLVVWLKGNSQQPTSGDLNTTVGSSEPLLAGLLDVSGTGRKVITVTSDLRLQGSFVLLPQPQPDEAVAGQLYYDEVTNALNYYNGTQFITLSGAPLTVESAGGTRPSDSAIDLPLAVVNGGTGVTSLAENGVILGNGSGALAVVTASGAGLCLTSTADAPVFASCPGSGDNPFVQGGNSFGATAVLGTNDSNGLNVEVNNSVVVSITTSGAASFQNTANSTNGFTVLNASAIPQFTVDTSNARVYVGNPTADSTGALLVLDTKNTSGDPTGLAGAMYYNANLGQFRCHEVDYWRDCNAPSARTTYYYVNDFVGIGSDSSLTFDNTAGGFATRTAEIGHPSIVYMDTGSSATTRLWVVPRASGGDGVVRFGGDYWRQEIAARIPSITGLSSGSEPYTFRTGFIDDASVNNGNGTDGCFFRYTDSLNSGKWQGVCRNSNSESTCDAVVTVAVDTWYRLTVIVNTSGTSTDFQINGVSRCQIASNIPTASGRETNWGIVLKKDGSGTASRQVDVDYMEVQSQFGSPR